MESSWVVIVPFAFPALMVALALGFAALHAYLKHKERMAMIERGILPGRAEPEEEAERASRGSTLTAGLVVGMIGLAITLGLITLGIGPWLIGGLVPMAIGAGLIASHYLEGRKGGPDGDDGNEAGGNGESGQDR